MERWGHRYIDVETGTVLDTWFPRVNEPTRRSCAAQKFGLIESENVQITLGDVAEPPRSIEEVYLRLHLLSECAQQPKEPLTKVYFRHYCVRAAPKHVRPSRDAATLVLTKISIESALP